MTENTLWMGFWFCLTFIICFIVASFVFRQTSRPTDNEVMLKLIDHGISPAVMECLDRDWTSLPVFEICRKVLTINNLTRKEAEELVNQLKEE